MSENQQQRCIKCDGKMIAGRAVTPIEILQIRPSVWMEIKVREYSPLPYSSDDIEKYIIDLYRCVECGYLESYATERTY